MRSLFNKEFIKQGVVSEEHGVFCNKMFGFRQCADYEDFIEFDNKNFKNWFDGAIDFLDSVEEVILKAINKAGD